MTLVLVAVALGLRHAADPDHLAALSTLIASDPQRGSRRARRLGLAWGIGHATTLIALGLPIIWFHAELPHGIEAGAEALIGLLVIVFALRLFGSRRAARSASVRSPAQAYVVGLVHGMGGSAGVTVVVLAGAPAPSHAAAALVLFAAATATSMAALAGGFGHLLARPVIARRLDAFIPALGTLALLFGAWYLGHSGTSAL